VLELTGGGVSVTPYVSVVIGVVLSLCFCVAFTCWTRRRHRRRRCAISKIDSGSCLNFMRPRQTDLRNANSNASSAGKAVQRVCQVSLVLLVRTALAPKSLVAACATSGTIGCRSRDFLDLQLGIRRGRSHRGVPKEILDSLPCHEFKASELAADGTAAVGGLPAPPAPAPAAVTLGTRAVAAPDVAANECSVCLCEYEEGEMVRTLVNCRCACLLPRMSWCTAHAAPMPAICTLLC